MNPDNTKNVQISTIDIPSDGRRVHLKGYGFVKVFRIVSKDGDKEHWAADLIDMEEPDRKELAHKSWKIEVYPHEPISHENGLPMNSMHIDFHL